MNNIIFKTLLLKGEQGSITSIEKTATNGLVDTYTVTYNDGTTTTFEVTNGNGIESIEKTATNGLVDTYTVTYNDGTTTTFEVTNGNGIESIEKTATSGLVDTYTVTLTDGSTTTFHVTNGEVGSPLNFNNRNQNYTSATDLKIYVATSGDDTNDGTFNNPVKTLKRAFELSAQYYTDSRIEIVESGTYDIGLVTNSGNIHISTSQNGVILNMVSNWINYACHLNISGTSGKNITIKGNGNIFYSDGSSIELDYIELDCDFRIYGGCCNFTTDCILHNIRAISAGLLFGKNITFKNTVVSNPVLNLTNCNTYFAYQWSIDLAEDDSNAFLNVYGGILTNTIVPTTTTNYKYDKNVVHLCSYITSETSNSGVKALADTNDIGVSCISNIQLN